MPAAPDTQSQELYIGMLSGTSRDGADLALVSFGGDRPTLEQSMCIPYPAPIAEALRDLIEAGQRPGAAEMDALNRELGEFFAACVHQLLYDIGVFYKKIAAIGSHGQTIWHEPPESIQLGDPHVIAKNTGIPTVGQFRQADLEAGGEGAPLAPLLHSALLRPESGRCGVLNLGGIANLTMLAPDGSVSGFDTGPANCLLDAWIRRHRGDAFDEDGAWASQGTIIQPVLMNLLEDRWFSRLPPKSTGVEYFNLRWLEAAVDVADFGPEDIQATLMELTAKSVTDAIPEDVDQVWVCGGGAHNSALMARLRARRPGCRFDSTAHRGLDPDCVEAMLFAWLARERLAERPVDTTTITGASQPVLLGSVHLPDQEV